VGHTGKTTSGDSTNRREEQLAIALWRACKESGLELPDGTILFPIDYQLPLKSHRNKDNAGLGKIDLFCAEAAGTPWICELKCHPQDGRQIDTPLKAALEALAYCATLGADMLNLSLESMNKQPVALRAVSPQQPNLLVIAPAEYWELCHSKESLYPWKEPLRRMRLRIENAFQINLRFVSIQDCEWEMKEDGAYLIGSPVFTWAIPDA
jgi:hypothetical protein